MNRRDWASRRIDIVDEIGPGRRVRAIMRWPRRSAPGESGRTRLQFVDAGTVAESAFT